MAKGIPEFISDLAVNAKISASTQTIAISALLFLCQRLSQPSDGLPEERSRLAGEVTRCEGAAYR